MPSMVGSVGCRRKSVIFCFFLFVTLLNDEVRENGNAIKQCNFQYNYGAIGFVVVHLYSRFTYFTVLGFTVFLANRLSI